MAENYVPQGSNVSTRKLDKDYFYSDEFKKKGLEVGNTSYNPDIDWNDPQYAGMVDKIIAAANSNGWANFNPDESGNGRPTGNYYVNQDGQQPNMVAFDDGTNGDYKPNLGGPKPQTPPPTNPVPNGGDPVSTLRGLILNGASRKRGVNYGPQGNMIGTTKGLGVNRFANYMGPSDGEYGAQTQDPKNDPNINRGLAAPTTTPTTPQTPPVQPPDSTNTAPAKPKVGDPTDPNKKTATATPTTPDYSSYINSESDALIAALRANIQKSIEAKKAETAGLAQKAQASKDASELQTAKQLRSTIEAAANGGDRGGIGRQNALLVQTEGANRLTQIDNQKSSEEAQINAQIAELVANGQIEEAQLMAQRSKDLYNEKIRAEEAAKTESQKAVENAWAKVNSLGYVDEESSKILGIPAGTKTMQGKTTDKQLSQQDIDNAWKTVETTGAVDENTSKILGIPVGTTTLEAQKMATDKKLAEAGLTGVYEGNPTLAGKEFDWNTDVTNNPTLAAAAESLKQSKAQFAEWQTQAPQRLALINEQVKSAKTANDIAAMEYQIDQLKLAAEKINMKYADKNAKAQYEQLIAQIADIRSQITTRAGQLNLSEKELALERSKVAASNSKKGSKTDLSPYKKYIDGYLTSDAYNELGDKTGKTINKKDAASYIVGLGLSDADTDALLQAYGLPTDEAGLSKIINGK